MFNRRKAFEPVKPEGHEGMGTEANITFSDAEGSWEETFDLIEILEQELKKDKLTCKRRKGWLVINNELYLRPEIAMFELKPTGVNTVTTISIAHQQYAPRGLFEYQHAWGDDTNSALTKGFRTWIELDLPVLLDAVGNSQENCTAMDMEFPQPSQRVRRALLGPVAHLTSGDSEIEDEHPFCSCCLLTNSFEAFRKHFEGEEFYGIRLLVLRNEDGELGADCRVNGIDWEPGKEHLIKYGETWTDRGLEMRKQYVVIYTKDANAS